MTNIDKQVKEILDRVKAKYKDMAKAQIVKALAQFKELQPLAENYVNEFGEYKDMFSLSGTIPVEYKNNVYNIPIQMYLPDEFPYKVPICYVRPTLSMSINVSDTVDSSGKISLPYLSSWNKTCELKKLIETIAIRFGTVTPLYHKNGPKPSASNTSYPTNIPPASSQPTSYPPSFNANQSLPYPSQNTSYPSSVPSVAQTPYPPYPPSNPPYAGYPYKPANYLNMPTPASYNPIKPPVPPPPPVYNNNNNQQRAPAPAYNSNYSDETIKPEFLQMSLISAVQDKARKRYLEYKEQFDAEINSLKRTENDLEMGANLLSNIITDAEIETENIRKYTIEIKQKTGQISENLNMLKHREKADIQDSVVPMAPLYRQIMQLFSEELAMQDFIYYLNEGLSHKTVSLESYLKQIRVLSRRLFMTRALILKCRETANLRT